MKRLDRFLAVATVFFFFVMGFGCATTTVERQETRVPEKQAAIEQKATPKEETKIAEETKKPAVEATTTVEKKAPAEETTTVAKVEPAAVKEVAPKIRALESIHFDFDKYNIRPPDREILARHAEWLKNNKDAKVTIEGHCDERGTVEYNLALGERRANEAKKYLVSLGVEPERIKTVSYGKERPIDPRQNEEAWAKNRRAEFIIE
ncbi:MAG: peptidoglycan-associated lipoprotein Pal [Syntrophales bacterium]|nr:peptidoglycan-associated lipoprotein Pal [Syntrophales bacterium]